MAPLRALVEGSAQLDQLITFGDVRDVAIAHANAIEFSAVGGKRIILGDDQVRCAAKRLRCAC